MIFFSRCTYDIHSESFPRCPHVLLAKIDDFYFLSIVTSRIGRHKLEAVWIYMIAREMCENYLKEDFFFRCHSISRFAQQFSCEFSGVSTIALNEAIPALLENNPNKLAIKERSSTHTRGEGRMNHSKQRWKLSHWQFLRKLEELSRRSQSREFPSFTHRTTVARLNKFYAVLLNTIVM